MLIEDMHQQCLPARRQVNLLQLRVITAWIDSIGFRRKQADMQTID